MVEAWTRDRSKKREEESMVIHLLALLMMMVREARGDLGKDTGG